MAGRGRRPEMAERRGTGGRGGPGTLSEELSMDDFAPVAESSELNRSRTAPSKLQPLVDMARSQPGRKFERTVSVPATDGDGSPVFETNEDGTPVADGDGNPIPKMVREPHTYTLDAAKAFAAELRNVGNRNHLSVKRLSLRIVADPPLAKATASDEIRVQFYIVSRKPEETAS